MASHNTMTFTTTAVMACACCCPVRAQDLLDTLDGEQSDRLLRAEVMGDIDGDGVEDLAITLFTGNTSGTPQQGSNGGAQVVSGRTREVLLGPIYGGPWWGPTAWVDGAGDFDGDGVPDFMRGVADWGYGVTPRVVVYSGVDGTVLHEFLEPPLTNDWGTSVTPVGDVDGDGYDDVLLGEEYGDDFHLYGGPDGHLIRSHTNVGSWFASTRSVGLVDGDAIPDYAFGLPARNRVRVHSGATGAVIHDVVGQGLFAIGLEVTGVGDVDGDQVDDFAAGAGTSRFSAPAPGEVFVFSGATAEILFHFQGEEWGGTGYYGNLGMYVDGGRDVNGDGVPDLIASAPMPLGGFTYSAYANVYSLRTGTLLWSVRRELLDPGPFRLEYARLFDDLDGDGDAEWGVGDVWAGDGGRIWIWAGAPGGAEEFCPAAPNSTGVPARLVWDGPCSIGHSRMSARIEDGPPHSFVLFAYGGETAPTAAGDGVLCIGAPFVRLTAPTPIDGDGLSALRVDWANGPQMTGPNAWTVGSSWAVQAVYRDPNGPGGSGFNTTSAWRVTFLP